MPTCTLLLSHPDRESNSGAYAISTNQITPLGSTADPTTIIHSDVESQPYRFCVDCGGLKERPDLRRNYVALLMLDP